MSEQDTTHSKVETPNEMLAVIRPAIFDPGRFVDRGRTEPRWEGDSQGYEPLHEWQARAVVLALGEAR